MTSLLLQVSNSYELCPFSNDQAYQEVPKQSFNPNQIQFKNGKCIFHFALTLFLVFHTSNITLCETYSQNSHWTQQKKSVCNRIAKHNYYQLIQDKAC